MLYCQQWGVHLPLLLCHRFLLPYHREARLFTTQPPLRPSGTLGEKPDTGAVYKHTPACRLQSSDHLRQWAVRGKRL